MKRSYKLKMLMFEALFWAKLNLR